MMGTQDVCAGGNDHAQAERITRRVSLGQEWQQLVMIDEAAATSRVAPSKCSIVSATASVCARKDDVRVVLGGPVETMVDGISALGQQARAIVAKPVGERRCDGGLKDARDTRARKHAQTIAHAALRSANDALHLLGGEKAKSGDGAQDRNVTIGDAEGWRSSKVMRSYVRAPKDALDLAFDDARGRA